MAILVDCPHNIQWNPIGKTIENGSIWPSTWEKWHDAQLCMWSLHIYPFQPFNNNTLKGKIFCICKITRCVVTFNVVGDVY
jgi:hypothetical protein